MKSHVVVVIIKINYKKDQIEGKYYWKKRLYTGMKRVRDGKRSLKCVKWEKNEWVNESSWKLNA